MPIFKKNSLKFKFKFNLCTKFWWFNFNKFFFLNIFFFFRLILRLKFFFKLFFFKKIKIKMAPLYFIHNYINCRSSRMGKGRGSIRLIFIFFYPNQNFIFFFQKSKFFIFYTISFFKKIECFIFNFKFLLKRCLIPFF